MLLELSEAVTKIAAAHPEVRLSFYPEAIDGSYFETARVMQLGHEDMVCDGELSALRRLWSESYPVLVPVVGQMERLATSFANTEAAQRQESEAPSTLVYQMW